MTDSMISKIDPRLKFVWCLTILSAALITDNILGQLILIGLLFISQWSMTKSLKSFGILTLVLLVVGSQLLIIQLLFCREGVVIWEWGILKIYSEAVPNALLGYLRTSALAYAAVQFIAWTPSIDGILMLKSFGLPYRYAMLVGVAARFFPLMQKEYAAISQSQMVRGLDTTGVWRKIKALPPTFFPLLYRALRRSADTALSMELRGFGLYKERTFTKELTPRLWEKLAIVLLLLVLALLVIFNIII